MSAAAACPQLLADTFLHVLEEAAFVFAEPTGSPGPFGGELVEATLAWSGPGAAELRVVVERGFAAALAASLVGEDEPDHARAGDAVGELLNIAAGTVAHVLSGGAETQLGVPRVRALAQEEWTAERDVAQHAVSLLEEHGHRIDVTLSEAEAGAAR